MLKNLLFNKYLPNISPKIYNEIWPKLWTLSWITNSNKDPVKVLKFLPGNTQNANPIHLYVSYSTPRVYTI